MYLRECSNCEEGIWPNSSSLQAWSNSTANEELIKKYDDDQTTGISIYELKMSPIRLYEPEEGDNLQQIEYFNPDFVSIDIIDTDGIGIGGYTRKYDELDDKVIDKIFIFMIDALENNMWYNQGLLPKCVIITNITEMCNNWGVNQYDI